MPDETDNESGELEAAETELRTAISEEFTEDAPVGVDDDPDVDEPEEKKDEAPEIDYKAEYEKLKNQNGDGDLRETVKQLQERLERAEKEPAKPAEPNEDEKWLETIKTAQPKVYETVERMNRILTQKMLREAGLNGTEDLKYIREQVAAQSSNAVVENYRQEGKELREKYGPEIIEKYLPEMEKAIKESNYTLPASKAFIAVANIDDIVKAAAKKAADATATASAKKRAEKAAIGGTGNLPTKEKVSSDKAFDMSTRSGSRDAFAELVGPALRDEMKKLL
jgi:hypothetical protein